MKVTEIAIKRPAAMIMVVMFFVVLGLFGYQKIGSDLFPDAKIPFVTVIAQYPGAGPEEMEDQITKELEDGLSSLNGLKETRSFIYEGLSLTALEFRMGTDISDAVNDTQKAVDRIMFKLPQDMEKPVIEKFDTNEEPVLTIAVSGSRPVNEIYDLADDTIKSRLETIPGVAAVSITGGQNRQVRIDIDQGKLDLYGLSVNQVIQTLKAENINAPSGNIKDQNTQFDVRLVGKFKSLEDIKYLPITLPRGNHIPIKEIAQISYGYPERTSMNRLNQKEAVVITVQKQSGASIVNTAAELRAELIRLEQSLPEDITMAVANDSSTFITNSLDDTKRTLIEGVIMTGLVLWIFLRDWRSLFIVMLAIPTSIIATFMMMYLFGFTFNILSLMGLSLSVGILVDDSIVVLENIHRHLKSGKDSVQAAIDGRGEIGMAAIAITLSDVVVFGPIAFMEGMVGQYLRQFGLTVVTATLFSLFVSFTLTPMLAAHFYKNHTEERGRERKKKQRTLWIKDKISALGNLVVNCYLGLLKWSLNHRLKVLAIVMGGVVASIFLIPGIGFEFLTQTDQGKFTIKVEMPAGTVLDDTNRIVEDLEERLTTIPEVANVVSSVGTGGDKFKSVSTPYLADIQVILKPKREREKTVWQVSNLTRAWTEDYPGVDIKVEEAQMVGIDNFGAPIVVEICGQDWEVLQNMAQEIKRKVEEVPGTSDVDMSWHENYQPEYQVVLDRQKTVAFSLTAAEIAQAMRSALTGDEISKIRLEDRDVGIWVRLQGADRKDLSDLGNISVTNRYGRTYLIKQLAAIEAGHGSTEIRHKNKERMISVSANYQNASLSQIQHAIDQSILEMDVPEGYKIEYDGMIEQMEDSNADLVQALILSLILVYMVLVILYESFLTPFIRMLSLPVGIIGALAILYLTGNTLNMLSIIGIIMLDGLAAKNGTLLIDYTNTLMERGLNLKEALLEAGKTRLRPIFMTSTTMIFGMLPTALAFADGSEIRRGMGLVLIGGLFTSTVLTPILIPVAYTLMDDLKKWLKNILQAKSKKKQLQHPGKLNS
jgi:HAE1 family hydrophobic/amphiphilic exporter-1